MKRLRVLTRLASKDTPMKLRNICLRQKCRFARNAIRLDKQSKNIRDAERSVGVIVTGRTGLKNIKNVLFDVINVVVTISLLTLSVQ